MNSKSILYLMSKSQTIRTTLSSHWTMSITIKLFTFSHQKLFYRSIYSQECFIVIVLYKYALQRISWLTDFAKINSNLKSVCQWKIKHSPSRFFTVVTKSILRNVSHRLVQYVLDITSSYCTNIFT